MSPLAVIAPRQPEHATGAGTPVRAPLPVPRAEAFLTALLGLRAAERDAGAVLDALAPLVRDAFGGHVVDVALSDARAARLVGGVVPHGPLADLAKRWRRDAARRPERAGDLAAVPLTDGERLVGVLRLHADVALDDPLLRLLGARAGEVLARLVEDARRSESDGLAEGLAQRERVARELPDVVERNLAPALPALDDLAAMALPPEAAARAVQARNAVTRAAAEAAQAAAVLDLFGGPRRGLLPSLRAVARELSAGPYGAVDVRTNGRPRDVDAAAGEALLRAARAAAVSAVRHGRAMLVTVTVTYAPDRVAVVVRDDGAGIAARGDAETGLVFGLRLMRRRLEELRGGLEVTHGRRGGAVVHAWAGVPE